MNFINIVHKIYIFPYIYIYTHRLLVKKREKKKKRSSIPERLLPPT